MLPAGDRAARSECVETCFDCARDCAAYAEACLGARHPETLVRAIRLALDCADICALTRVLLSRRTAPEPALLRALLRLCAEACRLCGDECAGHREGAMPYLGVRAGACRRCEVACARLLRNRAG